MNITQIRNATLFIEYAGKTFLIDPMLSRKGVFEGFPGTARSHLRNPLVELPVSAAELTAADAVIVTHTHLDHWDDAAQALIPHDKPVFVQHEADAELIRSQGFTCVSVLGDENAFPAGITVYKTDGQHGSSAAYAVPELSERLGDACGLVFTHPFEKTIYLAGDTVWVKPYVKALRHFRPDVIVLNTGFAHLDGFGPIIMGAEDVLSTLKVLPESVIVASHMEAVNHCVLSRAELRAYVSDKGIADSVFIPEDGERLTFQASV